MIVFIRCRKQILECLRVSRLLLDLLNKRLLVLNSMEFGPCPDKVSDSDKGFILRNGASNSAKPGQTCCQSYPSLGGMNVPHVFRWPLTREMIVWLHCPALTTVMTVLSLSMVRGSVNQLIGSLLVISINIYIQKMYT